MKTKPGVIQLAKEGNAFVLAHMDYAVAYTKPLIIYMLIFDAIAHIGTFYHDSFQLFQFVNLYFYACLGLAWHRAVLMGAKYEHVVKPFSHKPGDGSFLRAFFYIAFVPLLVIIVAAVIAGLMIKTGGILKPIGAIGLVIVLICALVYTFRASFMLPGRSMNAAIGYAEAKRISKGLVGRFVSSAAFVGLVAALALIVWIVIVAMIIGTSVGDPRFSIQATVLLYIFTGIPTLFITIFVTLSGITILSRLYQWAVEERG